MIPQMNRCRSSSYPFFTSLHLCTVFVVIILVVILSQTSHGAHPQYEACVPKNCGQGPNISFPFYISGRQPSYCGYPGFNLNCTEDDFPVLKLSENVYVVRNIFYRNQSLVVYDSAADSVSKVCRFLGTIRNTKLPVGKFDYVDHTGLHLFSNCSSRSLTDDNQLSKYEFKCDGSDVLGSSDLTSMAVYDDDEYLRNATDVCEVDVVAPVMRGYEEEMYIDGRVNIDGLVKVLKRGFVMNWTASDCSTCEKSGGRCGFNETIHQFKCFCTDRPHSRSCKPGNGRLKLIIAIAVSGLGIILILSSLITCVIWQRKKRLNNGYLRSRNKSPLQSSKSEIEGDSFFFGIPVFSYQDLEKVTNHFDSSREIGDGGFGTVYYGKLQDGREVAIKRLYEHNYRRMEQFMNEIKILTSLRHPNLVSLYGCTSRKSRELLLIYEYIPNGTVADHLHGERAKEAPLTWDIRMSIAIETAYALAYLHKSGIVHRDVKTNNILLDNNFSVKVADFGLSRLFPNDVTHISTAPQGTPGYVDPEYHQCYQLTEKSDVYSFGVVLIELISSMPAVDISRHRHEINLANLAINRIQKCAFDELIDPVLGYKTDDDAKRKTTSVAELAFRCLQSEKDLRPSMDEVLELLLSIQNGEGVEFEKVVKSEKENTHSEVEKILTSPETDDAVLLKKKREFMTSPNAVTDAWVSSSSTTTSSMG